MTQKMAQKIAEDKLTVKGKFLATAGRSMDAAPTAIPMYPPAGQAACDFPENASIYWPGARVYAPSGSGLKSAGRCGSTIGDDVWVEYIGGSYRPSFVKRCALTRVSAIKIGDTVLDHAGNSYIVMKVPPKEPFTAWFEGSFSGREAASGIEKNLNWAEIKLSE
ncbi:hypothetical protein PRIPAC_83273 [Pristionchus pacificus]|nr:hypothetical protein PRIPAC_83273 [Pristionchus pacificus]